MVEGIAFYAAYKSKVLIIPYKLYDFCLFIGLLCESKIKLPRKIPQKFVVHSQIWTVGTATHV